MIFLGFQFRGGVLVSQALRVSYSVHVSEE